MDFVAIVGLVVVAALLWPQVEQFQQRVTALEWAPAIAILICLRSPLPQHRLWLIGAIALATVTAHIGWNHVFAIASPDAFVSLGFAERTWWDALLAAIALRLPTAPGPSL